jgi:hypothetical protein
MHGIAQLAAPSSSRNKSVAAGEAAESPVPRAQSTSGGSSERSTNSPSFELQSTISSGGESENNKGTREVAACTAAALGHPVGPTTATEAVHTGVGAMSTFAGSNLAARHQMIEAQHAVGGLAPQPATLGAALGQAADVQQHLQRQQPRAHATHASVAASNAQLASHQNLGASKSLPVDTGAAQQAAGVGPAEMGGSPPMLLPGSAMMVRTASMLFVVFKLHVVLPPSLVLRAPLLPEPLSAPSPSAHIMHVHAPCTRALNLTS